MEVTGLLPRIGRRKRTGLAEFKNGATGMKTVICSDCLFEMMSFTLLFTSESKGKIHKSMPKKGFWENELLWKDLRRAFAGTIIQHKDISRFCQYLGMFIKYLRGSDLQFIGNGPISRWFNGTGLVYEVYQYQY